MAYSKALESGGADGRIDFQDPNKHGLNRLQAVIG